MVPTSCATTTPSEYGTRGHISTFPSSCPHVITQSICFFPSNFLEGALTLGSSLPCFHSLMWLSITQLWKQPSEESQSPWLYKTWLLWPLRTDALLFKGNLNLPPEKKNLMHWVFENSYILTYPVTVDSTWCNIINISLIYTQGTKGRQSFSGGALCLRSSLLPSAKSEGEKLLYTLRWSG